MAQGTNTFTQLSGNSKLQGEIIFWRFVASYFKLPSKKNFTTCGTASPQKEKKWIKPNGFDLLWDTTVTASSGFSSASAWEGLHRNAAIAAIRLTGH